MTSISKALNEYLTKTELQVLQTESRYKTNENIKTELNIDTKNKIVSNVYNHDIVKLLLKIFNIAYEYQIYLIGGGTQGFVIKFKSDNIAKGFDIFRNGLNSYKYPKNIELKNKLRIRGPYYGPTYPENIAVKIQIIHSPASFYEKRTLREEHIMHYLNELKPNANTSNIKNAIPRFYFGCTLKYKFEKRDIFFRLSFMDLIDNEEYITLDKYLYKYAGPQTHSNIYDRIEALVKELWHYKVSHNDLSVNNILLKIVNNQCDDIKLIDFGLSQMFNSTDNINTNEKYTSLFASEPIENRGTNVSKLKELCIKLKPNNIASCK